MTYTPLIRLMYYAMSARYVVPRGFRQQNRVSTKNVLECNGYANNCEFYRFKKCEALTKTIQEC